MGNIRSRPESGNLVIDFRYRGVRCREQTAMADTPANRKRLEALLARIEAEIALNTFEYARFFPDSPRATRFTSESAQSNHQAAQKSPPPPVSVSVAVTAPLFGEFAEVWFVEMAPQWRDSYRNTIRNTLDRHLLPRFGGMPLANVSKSEVLAFRAELANRRGKAGKTLSAERINHVMNPLRMILREASERFRFENPARNVRSLKVPRSDVEPFTLDEVNLIIRNVREDFRAYYVTRFFTGMRTAEIDGLKWQYVDFERRLIMVRETVVNGKLSPTKNDGSQREIRMSQPVFEALLLQREVTGGGVYVFCSRDHTPLYHRNVTNRVWAPLLRYLGLRPRRPYQTRHTAATLWLAAGESPEWIARQMGHTSTEMLFRVYSRYVPNLTRQDGSAFDRLIAQIGFSPPQ